MNSFSVPETIREKLHSVIREMSASPHLFVRKPEKHFTRRRKLPLEQLLSLLLRFGSGSLSRELLDFFQDLRIPFPHRPLYSSVTSCCRKQWSICSESLRALCLRVERWRGTAFWQWTGPM